MAQKMLSLSHLSQDAGQVTHKTSSHAFWRPEYRFTHPCRAIGLGETGRIYVGVNLEFPNLPLHHSVHAEQFLIANAVAHGERGLKRITVNAAPCGHCRQFIAELVTAVHFSCCCWLYSYWRVSSVFASLRA